MPCHSNLELSVKISLEIDHCLIQQRPKEHFVVSFPRPGQHLAAYYHLQRDRSQRERKSLFVRSAHTRFNHRSRYESLLFDPNEAFYRSGESHQWKTYFSPADLKQFIDISVQTMGYAGYNSNKVTKDGSN
jgi:hypothetical protein